MTAKEQAVFRNQEGAGNEERGGGNAVTALGQALARLTVIEVAAALGFTGLKEGVQKSPLREDRHGQSFSIFNGGRAFRDHANDEHKGGVWRFVQLAKPEWGKPEVAKFIIRAAGLDPEADCRASRAAYRTFKAAFRNNLYQRREDAMGAVKAWDMPGEWPACVRERYKAGWRRLVGSGDRRKELADGRGWPMDGIMAAVEAGLVADPELPWGERHGVAFLVQAPQGKSGDLVNVGYHQRFWRDGQKAWLYCPHTPQTPQTEYQRRMAEHKAKVPALPFVCGNVQSPRFGVILEGQWDALTLWIAAGWFEAKDGGPAVIWGCRGSESVEILLSAWGPYIKAKKLPLAIMPDGDAAGMKWTQQRTDGLRVPMPSVVDRLTAMGGRPTSVLRWGPQKDFNDWYREEGPSREYILDALAGCGFGVRQEGVA